MRIIRNGGERYLYNNEPFYLGDYNVTVEPVYDEETRLFTGMRLDIVLPLPNAAPSKLNYYAKLSVNTDLGYKAANNSLSYGRTGTDPLPVWSQSDWMSDNTGQMQQGFNIYQDEYQKQFTTDKAASWELFSIYGQRPENITVNVNALHYSAVVQQFRSNTQFDIVVKRKSQDKIIQFSNWVGSDALPSGGFGTNAMMPTFRSSITNVARAIQNSAELPKWIEEQVITEVDGTGNLEEAIGLLNSYLDFARAYEGGTVASESGVSDKFKQYIIDFFDPEKVRYVNEKNRPLTTKQYAELKEDVAEATSVTALFTAYNHIIEESNKTTSRTTTTTTSPTSSEESSTPESSAEQPVETSAESSTSSQPKPVTSSDPEPSEVPQPTPVDNSAATVDKALNRMKDYAGQVSTIPDWQSGRAILAMMRGDEQVIRSEDAATTAQKDEATTLLLHATTTVLAMETAAYRDDVPSRATAFDAALEDIRIVRSYIEQLDYDVPSEQESIDDAYRDVTQAILDMLSKADRVSYTTDFTDVQSLLNSTVMLNTQYAAIGSDNNSVQTLGVAAIDSRILEVRRQVARARINSSTLYPPERTAAIGMIAAATDENSINAILEEALSPENLELSSAKWVINTLGYLNDEQRADYLEQLTHATTVEEIAAVAKEAAVQSVRLSPISEVAKNRSINAITNANDTSTVSINVPEDNWNKTLDTDGAQVPSVTVIPASPTQDSDATEESAPETTSDASNSEPSTTTEYASGSTTNSIFRWILLVLGVLGAAGIGFFGITGLNQSR
ncbi:MAG: GA module-containing protein [Corynebacterium sp.]|nr:GA module-containing protein [Corynebacterium sp.]